MTLIETLNKPERDEGESMTRQELRARLFETLRTAGIADKLKSQLRAKIVAELKLRVHANLRGKSTEKGGLVDNASGPATGRLLHQVLDSMLVEYLKARGFDFTLSVFLPESGLNQPTQILAKDDILQALHLDHRTPFFRQLSSSMNLSQSVYLADMPMAHKDVQTDLDDEDLLEIRMREADKGLAERTKQQAKINALHLEERMLRYQQELEARLRTEMEQQLMHFRSIELSQMRAEERNRYQTELSRMQAEFEGRAVDIQEQAAKEQDRERARLAERQKELDRENLELRQKLLEENNRAAMREAASRAEAELKAKEMKLEHDTLQRRYDEAAVELSQLRNVKEEYANKLQQSMAQYKIDTNREYQTLMSNVEIQRAQLEAERAMLREKTTLVDKMKADVQTAQLEIDDVRARLKLAQSERSQLKREKEDADRVVTELRGQIASQKTSSALEYEIQSLKQQLFDAEKTAEKRQEEYQSLLKSMMSPDTHKELAKCRRSEAKWQRECQQLVLKLDMEMSRYEEIRRKYDDKLLQVKELKRENADLRLVCHQTREALNNRTTQLPLLDVLSPEQRRDFLTSKQDDDIDEIYQRRAQKIVTEGNTYENTVRRFGVGIGSALSPGLSVDPHLPSRARVEIGAMGVPVLEEYLDKRPTSSNVGSRRPNSSAGRRGDEAAIVGNVATRAAPFAELDATENILSDAQRPAAFNDQAATRQPISHTVKDQSAPNDKRKIAQEGVPQVDLLNAPRSHAQPRLVGLKEPLQRDVLETASAAQLFSAPARSYAVQSSQITAEPITTTTSPHQSHREERVADHKTKSRTQISEAPAAILGPKLDAGKREVAKLEGPEPEERVNAEADAAAEAERHEIVRQKAERQLREQQRLAEEAAELERVRREKEALEREEQARLRRLQRERELEEIDRQERERARRAEEEKRRKEEEDRRRETEESEREEQRKKEESRKEDEQKRKVEELENDPVMQKYMAIVKERKGKEAKENGKAEGKDMEKLSNEPSIATRVEDMLKKLDTSSFLSSRSSISGYDFGAGDTDADEVSAPTFDEDSNADEPW